MAKLTAKTTKVGQKGTLLKDSDLYHRMVKYHRPLKDGENGWQWGVHTNVCVIFDENSYRFIGKAGLEEIERWDKTERDKTKIVKTLKKGTVLQVMELKHWSINEKDSKGGVYEDWNSDVRFKVIGGENDGFEFVSELKSIQARIETGEFEDLAADINEAPKYKIFYKDKPYKNKIFGDLVKVKASIMDAIGYNDKVYQLNQHYLDFSPEVSTSCPEWFQGMEQLKRSDMKDIKVYEWANRKKGKDSGFDALAYYDSLMDYMKVTAQYGSAVRQIYKDNKDGDFTTIVCFRHEDYKQKNRYYYDDLKESDTIKNAIKNSKVKGHKKCTKQGKTAIIFKNESDAMKVLRNLSPEDYMVLDMSGTELIIQSEEFVRNVARMKKLERVLFEKFADDFESKTK